VDISEAIEIMQKRTLKYAFCYGSAEEAGVERFSLKECFWDEAHRGGVIMNKETKMYSIGQENVEGNEFAMWHGPNPNLDEMLRVVGVSKRSVILEYEEAQEGLINIKVIYRWNKTIWEKV